MNQVTFSSDRENLLFIHSDQVVKYPLQTGVMISFVDGQPVAVKPSQAIPQSHQLEIPSSTEKALDIVLDKKNSKAYIVGEIDVVIGLQGTGADEKQITTDIKSINFDSDACDLYIEKAGDDIKITIISK